MTQQKIVVVPLEDISMNPYQPRKEFVKEEIEELAQSIRSVGLIHPPLVRPLESLQGKYELIAGERRCRAASIAGLKTIPVAVIEQKQNYSAEASLIENLQRVDLNALEIAQALKRLLVDYGLQQEQLAQRVGKKRSTIANYLRLLTLPGVIQESLRIGELTMGHAKVILSLEETEKQLELHAQIVKEKLSVREAEEVAQKVVQECFKRSLNTLNDCFLRDIEERLERKFGTKVVITSCGKKGRVSIDYYSLDDLDRLLELIL